MRKKEIYQLVDSVVSEMSCPCDTPDSIDRWRTLKSALLAYKIETAINSFLKQNEKVKHDESLELVSEHFKDTWYVKCIYMSDEENIQKYHIYADAARYYDSMVDNPFIKYCSLLKVK